MPLDSVALRFHQKLRSFKHDTDCRGVRFVGSAGTDIGQPGVAGPHG
jgi:hypothetical protein